MKRKPVLVAAAFLLALSLFGQAFRIPEKLDLRLPNKPDSVRFAVIGDQGDASPEQYQVAELMSAYRRLFPYDIVLMNGDMLYGSRGPEDYVNKFEKPYKALLDQGVKFYGTLGNHDNTDERNYKGFNMNGQRYYSFSPREGVRFFALDSTDLDAQQIEWLNCKLPKSGGGWKIAFFHHPPYSSGRTHGSSLAVQKAFVPLFIKYKVDVVFSGHDHIYERLKPLNGVQYFVEGASGKLRKGDIVPTTQTAVGYDQDNTFMLLEIDGDQLHYQAISRTGETVDSGIIVKERVKAAVSGG